MRNRPVLLSDFGMTLSDYGKFLSEKYNDEEEIAFRRKKLLSCLEEAVEHSLTEKQKRAVRLYYFEHRDMAYIAALVNTNKAAVSKLLKRARKTLCSELKFVIR